MLYFVLLYIQTLFLLCIDAYYFMLMGNLFSHIYFFRRYEINYISAIGNLFSSKFRVISNNFA